MAEAPSVGRSLVRKDAWDKVTGKALYVDDLRLEGALHGAVVRSAVHHAHIVEIDTRAAQQLAGVVAVITAEDIPGEKTFGPIVPDQPPLASDVVRHMGEPVALVVAETRAAAQEARHAVRVRYDALPVLLDPVEAASPESEKIHPGGNVVSTYDLGRGDVETGFAQSDVILEQTFRVPRVSPAYLEPETAAAAWEEDGSLTVWVSSQRPFEDRGVISRVLQLPEERIRVRVLNIGGAFGGKEDSELPILAALAAYHTGRAVRLVNTREESMQAHPKRHAAVLHYKVGAKRDGQLLAIRVEAYLDTGAYASYGPAVGGALTEIAAGPYRTPHVRIHTQVVYTNGPLCGAMRGFGAPQAAFSMESMMDMLADRLGLDPVELRRKNVWHKGERTPSGVLLTDEPSLGDCLDEVEKAVAHLSAVPPTPGKKSGVGFALLVQAMGLGYRVPDDVTNRIEWLPDGRARLDIGTPDLGQGTMTVAAQIAADALGIPYEAVDLAELDTSVSPNGGVSCASRMTYMVGNAARLAARSAIAALLKEASQALGIPAEDLRYRQGRVHRAPEDSEGIPAAEFCSRAAERGEGMVGEGTYSFPYPPQITPQDLPFGMPHVMFGYGAHVARVEVDPEFGSVAVREIIAIHDIGKAINPTGAEGQIEGGVAMGVGYALQEELKLKADQRWTDSFTEYLVPTTMDTPAIRPVLLEHAEPSGPYGARGVAEMCLTPVAPAIANAVARAIGVRVTALPIRPEVMLQLGA
jgi:xanthine dehydrogenase molybdenum-binding subunit